MPRAFVDSNVLIYSVGDDDARRERAEALIALRPTLTAGCDVLYSEDLQHGQVIDGTLTIVNPFVD